MSSSPGIALQADSKLNPLPRDSPHSVTGQPSHSLIAVVARELKVNFLHTNHSLMKLDIILFPAHTLKMIIIRLQIISK